MMKYYKTAVVVLAATFIVLGFVLLIVTAVHGGGAGLLIGALFIALGTGRLVLLRRG
ncbi:MAG: hypothetical protein ACR2MU_07930 [Gaiellaceae bacterium]